jgi:MEMO1 family protein
MTIRRSSTPPTERRSPFNKTLLLTAGAGLAFLIWGAAASLGQATEPAPDGQTVTAAPSIPAAQFAPLVETGENATGLIPSNSDFYDEVRVGSALARQEIRPKTGIRGIIVPHHLLAAPLIARGYGEAPDGVDTVFVVGPNHTNNGGARLATTSLGWETPLGGVSADAELARRATLDIGVADLPTAFTREHSVGAQMTFIRSRYPQARVVPIILDSYTGRARAEELGRWLAANSGEGTLAVFSIDFSHYLTGPEADIRDAETRQTIEGGDLNKISRFGNDNVDSPASLIAALAFARAAGLRPDIVANTNSNDFLPSPADSTTSHFLIELRE